MRWAVLVGGTGSNLAALLDRGIDIGLVVSHRAEVGALVIARAHRVPAAVLLPSRYASREAYGADLRQTLENAAIDAVAMAGFLRWLDTDTVRSYRGRIFNIHPSLLPAFPGLHAIGQALVYGVRWTGVTVHLVDEGRDSGPVVAQEPVPVEPEDDEESLAARIHAVEHRLYGDVLQAFEQQRFFVCGRKVVWRQ